jgi:tripartite ATP-independent transporter DctP family solute receptor
LKLPHFLQVAALCALCVSSIAHAQNQSKIRLWNTHPEGYPVTVALQSFAEEVNAATRGRIQIEVVSKAAMGDQPQAVQMMKAGTLDLAEFNLAALAEAVPSMKSINLPFLFADSAHMFRLLDGLMGDSFNKRLASGGYVVLGWYDGGGRSFYCVNRRLTGPRDFAGLRIRVQPSEAYVEMVKLLGATPVTVPYKDVMTAFEQDKIDCAENNLPAYVSTGHYKVAKQVFLTNHVVAPEALVVSTKAWEALGSSDQAVLRNAGKKSALYMRELWNKQVKQSREIATKAGTTFEQPIEFGAYVSRMKPLHQKYWKDPATRNELVTILANYSAVQ